MCQKTWEGSWICVGPLCNPVWNSKGIPVALKPLWRYVGQDDSCIATVDLGDLVRVLARRVLNKEWDT